MPISIVNLTPHAICVHVGEPIGIHPEYSVTIEPATPPARVEMLETAIGQLSLTPGDALTAPVYQTKFGEIKGVPLPTESDAIYIVSRVVAEALKEEGWDMQQFLVPHDLVRDERGHIIGCRGFARV